MRAIIIICATSNFNDNDAQLTSISHYIFVCVCELLRPIITYFNE